MVESSQTIGYYSSVTEVELGWGCRPDGYIVGLTKEAVLRRGKEKDGHVWVGKGEYCDLDHEPRMCIINTSTFDNLISRQLAMGDKKLATIWLHEKSEFLMKE